MTIECTGLGQFMDVNTGTIENVLMLQNPVTGVVIHIPVSEESFQAVIGLRAEEGVPAPDVASSVPTNGSEGPGYLEPSVPMGSIAEGLLQTSDEPMPEDPQADEAAYVDLPDLGEEYSL